jgi:hypothetical protein
MVTMRGQGKLTAIYALGGTWLAVSILAVTIGVRAEERELEATSTDAIEAAGLNAEIVGFDGRDAVVAVAESDRSAAESTLLAVRGVRTVRWDESTPPVVAAPTTTTAPGTTSTTTTSPTRVAPTVAALTATLDQGHLTVTGVLPDAQAAGRLGAVVDLIYAPFLDNGLVVDVDVAGAAWVDRADVVAVLPILSTASVTLEGDAAVVTGLAPTEERRAKIVGAISAAVGPEVEVRNDVIVTGLGPPIVEAAVSPDGTVRLGGVVPSEEIATMLRETMVGIYGIERLVDELVVADDVDASFSLFRLPVVFPLFAPISEWQLKIEDDVITGALRGGATFASGSAELTPELLGLLDIAAGILLRNPTLGLTIEGHTDAIGSETSNQRLSEQRATNAAAYLVAAGIADPRLAPIGYGESRPIADNTTAEGRARNRRVDFGFGPVSTGGR